MKYISRNKIYEKVEPFKDAKKIYIFCEGEKKETGYFKFFKGFVSNIDIIPIPCEDGKSDPSKLKEQAEFCLERNSISLSKEMSDEVWFVIDTDMWNEGDKIGILKNFVEMKNGSYAGWFVAQSNPSFEIWLYYHFYPEKPNIEEVETHSSFKEYVAAKIKGGFDNRSMPIKIQEAASNAKENFESEDGQPKLYSTEVFKLANQIITFTKTQLDECINSSSPNP